ncbi:MAG: hypothetical protein ABW022_23585 [Actinoplanes sp.]
MTKIVVSRRDGILRAPDGTKYRIARGRTLAEADHPAVVANPGDWVPMVVTLTVADRPEAEQRPAAEGSHAELIAQLEDAQGEAQAAEDEAEHLRSEMNRLAEGLAAAGITLPAEDDREPGWLVDLALEAVGAGLNALKEQVAPAARSGFDDPQPATPEQAPSPPKIAPPKPRKRSSPPITTRTGDDG